MTSAYAFPSRKFQVWLYTVGHRMLLIRSVRTDVCPTRIDVLFSDVSFFALPTWPDGLSLRQWNASHGDVPIGAAEWVNSHRGVTDQWWLLEGDGWRGYVCCGSVSVAEDTLGYDDPSPFSESLMGRA